MTSSQRNDPRDGRVLQQRGDPSLEPRLELSVAATSTEDHRCSNTLKIYEATLQPSNVKGVEIAADCGLSWDDSFRCPTNASPWGLYGTRSPALSVLSSASVARPISGASAALACFVEVNGQAPASIGI